MIAARVFSIVAGATIFAMAVFTPARAEDVVSVSYDVEVSRIKIMEVHQTAKISKTSYETSFRAKTKGMASFFADIKLNLKTTGTRDGNAFRPAVLDFNRKRGDNDNAIAVKWNSKGVASIERKFEGDALKRLQGALSEGARDPLSILLELGLQGGDTPCKGTYRAYDGRDVYDLIFEQTGAAEKTVSCRITAISVAGRDYDKALPKKLPPSVYAAELTRISHPSLEREIYVPYRIKGELEGRDFRAKLDDLVVNGAQLAD